MIKIAWFLPAPIAGAIAGAMGMLLQGNGGIGTPQLVAAITTLAAIIAFLFRLIQKQQGDSSAKTTELFTAQLQKADAHLSAERELRAGENKAFLAQLEQMTKANLEYHQREVGVLLDRIGARESVKRRPTRKA